MLDYADKIGVCQNVKKYLSSGINYSKLGVLG